MNAQKKKIIIEKKTNHFLVNLSSRLKADVCVYD